MYFVISVRSESSCPLSLLSLLVFFCCLHALSFVTGFYPLLFHTLDSHTDVLHLWVHMLKTKSFDLMDSDGINALLEQYPLAEGASIFVSEGKICIPYEDGEPETDEVRRVKVCAEVNKMERQIAVIEHSNKVLDVIKKDLEAKFATADADYKSAPNNKRFEADRKEIEDAIRHNDAQVRQNVAELERMQLNIKLFNESYR